jgi:hypothetical protein
MSRVVSARIAGLKAAEAGLPVAGSVMASDAFFPFRDGIDAAAEAGIRAVIQPGGSMRDDEVIAAADEHGMAMVFTGVRHFPPLRRAHGSGHEDSGDWQRRSRTRAGLEGAAERGGHRGAGGAGQRRHRPRARADRNVDIAADDFAGLAAAGPARGR